MLSRYEDFNEPRPIPAFGKRYFIDLSGNIFDTRHNRKINSFLSEGRYKVGLKSMGFDVEFDLAVLLSIVSRKCLLHWTQWHLLDVWFKDNNPENYHPSNTVWKFPESGIPELRYPGFRQIPGFSRYCIRYDGTLIGKVVDKEASYHISAYGYKAYGLQPDIGSRRVVCQHRLLAYAFLPYPANVDELDVNHKDGVKLNNDLSNLEWATRKENCDHAYSHGLRDDNLDVVVRDVFSGEERYYYSLEDCGRQLGIDGQTVRLRVNTSGRKIYPPGLLFKLLSDPTPWFVCEDPLAAMRQGGTPIPVLLENLETKQRWVVKSFKEAALVSGLSINTILARFRKSTNTVLKGWYLSIEINNGFKSD